MPVPPAVTPEATPDDVAALLRARTKDAAGRELGTWTDETRPNAAQVQEQIDIARTLIRLDVRPIPDACLEGAEAAIALLAAMLVEQAYWPEQVGTGNLSAYDRLAELYQQTRLAVMKCAGVVVEGDYGAYDLYVGGERVLAWPVDFWQRDMDNWKAWWDTAREIARGQR